jgi:hypothetical protein
MLAHALSYRLQEIKKEGPLQFPPPLDGSIEINQASRRFMLIPKILKACLLPYTSSADEV